MGKEAKDWSEDGQVFFVGGKGYGLTEEPETICLGPEEDILKAFETGEPKPDLNPLQRHLLLQIIDYRQEEGIGGSITRAAGVERGSDNGAAGRKPKSTRQIKARKGISVRRPRQKRKMLFG